MNRREMLKAGLPLPATAVTAKHALAESVGFSPKPVAWRSFDIVTQIDLPAAQEGSQAWIPLPSLETDWARTISNTWTGNATSFELTRERTYNDAILHIRWAGDVAAPTAQGASRVSTRDRSIDLSRPGQPEPLSDADRRLNLAATDLIPTDGIVKATA